MAERTLKQNQRVSAPATCFDSYSKSSKNVVASVVNPRRKRNGGEATALLRCEQGVSIGKIVEVPLRFINTIAV